MHGTPKRELRSCSMPLPNKNLKTTDSVDTIILNVLCDLAFSQNQPQKLADD
jgi:hypothetical protein